MIPIGDIKQIASTMGVRWCLAEDPLEPFGFPYGYMSIEVHAFLSDNETMRLHAYRVLNDGSLEEVCQVIV